MGRLRQTTEEIQEILDKVESGKVGSADWNASEGESGYIENKPFGNEFIKTTWTIDESGSYVYADSQTNVVKFDGNIIELSDWEVTNMGGFGGLYDNELKRVQVYGNFDLEDISNRVLVSDIKQLDEQYIPDTIARTKDVEETTDELREETTALWENLDHGTFPNLTAGDLAGRGESVPAEFGFRASGGKSIKDGRAYIKRIKGNSVVWNQYIDNTLSIGKFKSGNNSKASLSVVGNVFRLTTLVQGSVYAYYRTDELVKSLIVGHKYLRLATMINNTSGNAGFRLFDIEGDTNTTIASNTNGMFYNIFSLTNINITSPYLQIQTSSSNVDEYIEFSNVQFVDLTKAFPNDWQNINTIEDFNARVATLGVDMNAYNEGQVIHCNTESIKSVGDNAWDEEWEVINGSYISSKNYIRVIPNATYYTNVALSNGIRYYDKDYNRVGSTAYAGAGQTFIVPANVQYMKFSVAASYGTTYNHDICIRLAHTGYKTDYEPYWQDTLPLPIIRKYFPQGMKKAGTAYDEIRFNKASGKWEAVQRIGSVDMGTYRWYKDSSKDFFKYEAPIQIGTYYLCGKYNNISIAQLGVDRGINVADSGRGTAHLRISDLSYTNEADLNASLQRVMLYYELAEPIVTELDAEDQNFRDYYNVADFGTEMSQSSVPSTPFSADIIYQFNAVDMIREHELEITELQNIIATMQAQLTSLINGGQ